MNPKIKRVMEEIEKTKVKLAEQQARLRELERQKTELENAEIVAIFRKEKMTEDEFARFVSTMSAKSVPAPCVPVHKEGDHEE